MSAEAVPFVKVGGLADVTGALSRAVADLGCAVAVFLPRYADMALPEGTSLELIQPIDVPVRGEDQQVLLYRLKDAQAPAHLHHYFIASERYFGRSGIYDD